MQGGSVIGDKYTTIVDARNLTLGWGECEMDTIIHGQETLINVRIVRLIRQKRDFGLGLKLSKIEILEFLRLTTMEPRI